MSEIDSYKHECIGIVVCPSSYEIVYRNPSHRNIPLYRIDEDTDDGDSFRARRGDLLLGGGSGESAALRISIQAAFASFTGNGDTPEGAGDALCHAYWTVPQAFVFGEGYRKLGWTPEVPIETWLTEHILAFVLREYPAVYGAFRGTLPPDCDGSICRLPTPEERAIW